MSLAPGTRIGPYEVISMVGAGGMGQVFRARDTRLKREVALKVLPDSVANDGERLARFTREAQTLASLNHPNIAHTHGLEESGGVSALVMELVEGEDLSITIARGPMALADVVPIATQIADALEAAHEAGIVHRDLKPANIKVRANGTVKVLDFGLAKAVDPVGSTHSSAAHSPTLTAHATAMGMIIGTAAYMAPEQARGKPVDRRADIWAFGAVLFEMLSGQRAFDGEDVSSTLASVLKDDVQWGALPKDLPAPILTLLRRCLEKDPKRRLSWIGETRLLLENPGSLTPTPPAGSAARAASSRTWKIATALLGLTTMAAIVTRYQTPAPQPAAVRFQVMPPESLKFSSGANGRPAAAVPVISPDGRTVAFTAMDGSGKRQLWVRPIDALTAQPLPGTDGAGWPFWSPDSRSLAYSAGGKLMRVAVAGGPPLPICALAPNVSARGGAWNRDGVIVFSNGPAALHRVPAGGGAAMPIGQLSAAQTGQSFPVFLPDGRHLLYYGPGSADVSGVWVGSIDGGETRRLLPSDTGAVYDARNGVLLFGRRGTLMGQRFDPETLTLSGDPFPIAERVESDVVPGVVAFSVSDTGVLVYGVGAALENPRELVWIDRHGKQTGTVGAPANYRGIDLSPDGTRVAAHRHDGEGGDIWITEVSSGRTSRFTFDATHENASPVWSPDGSHIAYSSKRSGRPGLYVKNADNTGDDLRIFEIDMARGDLPPQPQSWSSDGRSVLFGMTSGVPVLHDLWLVPLSGDQKATPILNTPSRERWGQFSPDGKWIAYVASEGGTNDVYVGSATPGGGKWAVSTGGGGVPRWRGDSRELFYFAGGKILAVDITPSGGAVAVGAPRPVVDLGNVGTDVARSHTDLFWYAVAKDGQRLLVSRPVAASDTPSPIVVVTDWIEGLRR